MCVVEVSNITKCKSVRRQAKLDKKLRMVDLQLKKMRLDQAANANSNGPASSIEGEGTVIDRNSLLAEIMKQQKK